MKSLLCIATLLTVASLALCQSSKEELMAMRIASFKDYIKERQAINVLTQNVEKICRGYGSKFQVALMKTQNCINDIDESKETMCSLAKNYFKSCTKPIKDLLEECLPEKSKDTPGFVTESIMSVSDYLCKTDGEHILELSNPCVRSYNYRSQTCSRRIRSRFQNYGSEIPTKQEMCTLMSSLKGCIESHLHHNCGNPKTREAFINIYNAAQAPCQTDESDNMNEIE